MDPFYYESLVYVVCAGILQALLAIPLVLILVLIAWRRGPGTFHRLFHAYVVFNSFLLIWGCLGHYGITFLTFHKLYVSVDRMVDWYPFIPFGQWVLNQGLGPDSHGYLIGDTTLWQLRWIWLGFATLVWLLTYFSTRWALACAGRTCRFA